MGVFDTKSLDLGGWLGLDLKIKGGEKKKGGQKGGGGVSCVSVCGVGLFCYFVFVLFCFFG